MADEITRFNEAMAKAVENLQASMTEVKESTAEMRAILSHYSKNQDLILEVIKENRLAAEAQEKRHFEQMKLITDEHKDTAKRAFDAIGDIEKEQTNIKAKLKYAAGIIATILFLVTFLKDPIIKLFTRDEQTRYERHNHEPK